MRQTSRQLALLAAALLSFAASGFEYHHEHHHHPQDTNGAAEAVPDVPHPASGNSSVEESQPAAAEALPAAGNEHPAESIEVESGGPEPNTPKSPTDAETPSPMDEFTEYTEYGIKFPRAKSYKTLTHLMESPKDKTCTVASDCTRKCVESCELALVDHKCSVASKCSSTCRLKDCSSDVPHHPDGANCQYQCDSTCITGCRGKEEKSVRGSYERCLLKKEEPCMEECTKAGEHSPQVCKKTCAARARSSCTSSAMSSCLSSCGRHVCDSDGRCKCPFILKGNSMCTTYSWMRNLVVDHVKYCFQSPFEQRFQTTKFGDTRKPSISPGFFYEQIRNMDNAIEASSKRNVPYKGSKLGGPEIPAPDLPDIADFSTCAVIGGSGSLTGKGYGPEIDNHTTVIRFNDAPTSGYEADVGSKTTMRVQNNMYCGFCEKEDEILFPYTISTVENFCYPRMNRPTCQVYKSSNELRNFVTRFFEPFLQQFAEDQFWVYDHASVLKGIGADEFGMEPIGEVPKYKAQFDDDTEDEESGDTRPSFEDRQLLSEQQQQQQGGSQRRRLKGDKVAVTQLFNGTEVPLKDISAGLTGVLMAMHMCHKVDVYGFNNANEGYYYPKIKRPDRDWGMIHYWELERICLDAYNKYVSRVQFH